MFVGHMFSEQAFHVKHPSTVTPHGEDEAMTTTMLPLESLAAVRGSVRPVPAHVYRRRRLVAVLLVAPLVFCTTLVAGELAGRVTGTPGTTPAGAAGEPVVYVVQPGDTLWAIAARFTPAGVDRRHTVDRLAEVTGGALLQPGQRIVLPVG